jgi:O-antigen ligase
MFCAVAFLSCVYAGERTLAFDQLRRLLSVILLCFLISRLAGSRQRIEILILALFVSTLITSFVVIYDGFLGKNLLGTADVSITVDRSSLVRSSGATDTDPTTAAATILATTLMALMFFVRTSRLRSFTGIVVMVGSAAVIMSFARSAALNYALMLCVLLFKFRDDRRFPLCIAASLFALVILAALAPAEYWHRLATLLDFEADRTLLRRFSYQIIGLDLITKHPVLGVGLGNFSVNFIDFGYRWIPGRTDVARELHNMYLEVAAETGLAGLFCFLGILWASWKALNAARMTAVSPELRIIAEAIQFGFVSLLISSIFLPSMTNKNIWIFVGLSAAVRYVHKFDQHRHSATVPAEKPAHLQNRSDLKLS